MSNIGKIGWSCSNTTFFRNVHLSIGIFLCRQQITKEDKLGFIFDEKRNINW